MKTNYESYLEGLKEGWELVWAISTTNLTELGKIFKLGQYADPYKAIKKFKPEDALKLYKDHLVRVAMAKVVSVGDVVEYKGERGVVLNIQYDIEKDLYYDVYTQTGEVKSWWCVDEIKKCNKHIEVLDWIKQGIEGAVVLDD